VVDAGRVVTTAGVSAGIDGSLHVVKRLLGEQAARDAARSMEYKWEPEPATAK
jgi:transcriptional regulator GlxA family with amidase domain